MVSFVVQAHLLAAVQHALDRGKAQINESLQSYSYIHRVHFSTASTELLEIADHFHLVFHVDLCARPSLYMAQGY